MLDYDERKFIGILVMKALFIGFGSIAKKHRIALEQVVPEIELFALRRADSASIELDVTSILDWKNQTWDVKPVDLSTDCIYLCLTLTSEIRSIAKIYFPAYFHYGGASQNHSQIIFLGLWSNLVPRETLFLKNLCQRYGILCIK